MLFLWDSGIRWPSISNLPTPPGSVAQGFTPARCSALRRHSCWRNSEKGSTNIGRSNWESFTKAVRFQFIFKGRRKSICDRGAISPVTPESSSLYWDDAEETDSPWNTHLFHEVVDVMGRHPVGFHIYYNLSSAINNTGGKATLILFQVIDLFRNLKGNRAAWPRQSGHHFKGMSICAPKAQES